MSEQAEQLGLAKLAMTTSAESVDSEVLPSQDVSLARSSAKNSAPRLPDNPLAPASRSNTSSPSSPQLDRIADVTLPPIAPAASTAIPRASPTITDQTPVPAAVPLANATRTQSPYQAIAMGIEVSAARVDSPPANANIPAGPLAGNPSNNARLELPTLNRQTLDTTQLPTSALAGLQRASRGDHLAFAEGNIRLQTLLRLRKADDTAKRNLLQKFGASDETLVAIERGLNWIELHQHDDGHWSLNKFGECCSRHEGGKCAGHGGVNSDTAATGLALLPFLGDGHTHLTGKHQAAVAKGLQWLVTHQRRDSDPRKDGDLFTGNKGDNAYLYSHGIATIALCEAYAMSGDDALRDPAQRAVNFIVHAQHRDSGGWRYHPNQAADTSVVGWQVMALKSAQMANLHVPEGVLDLARKWLDSVAGKNDQLGRFAYQGGAYSPTMTAEALLCREYLGAQRDDADLQGGQRYLLAHLPQFMFHMQGDGWKKWNGAINPLLLGSQVKEGSLAGTWKPKDQWENSGGTIYATSLRLLMLEVYYRHLPLYRTLDE
jgi:hypothetical protein